MKRIYVDGLQIVLKPYGVDLNFKSDKEDIPLGCSKELLNNIRKILEVSLLKRNE